MPVTGELERSWAEEKKERERTIVRLLRGVGHTKEDAWLDGWHGEGLKRRNAIKVKKGKGSEKTRYMRSAGLSCSRILLPFDIDRAARPTRPITTRKSTSSGKHTQDEGLPSAALNASPTPPSSTFASR